MVRGQYIAGTGMLLQRRVMEAITNNITNADTTGYKQETLTARRFDDVLLERLNDYDYGEPGPLNFGTQIDQLYVDYTTGSFEETGRPGDLALEGDVFFAIETPDGERYTRSGAFEVDDLGYLTDSEGNFLSGENGRINVGQSTFSVDGYGNVSVDGEFIDRIRLVSFADNDTLRKQGSNLFYATEEPIAPNEYKMLQGFLESSNVDIGREMVDMIATYRAYETNQRMLTIIDESVGLAVTEIGRVR